MGDGGGMSGLALPLLLVIALFGGFFDTRSCGIKEVSHALASCSCESVGGRSGIAPPFARFAVFFESTPSGFERLRRFLACFGFGFGFGFGPLSKPVPSTWSFVTMVSQKWFRRRPTRFGKARTQSEQPRMMQRRQGVIPSQRAFAFLQLVQAALIRLPDSVNPTVFAILAKPMDPRLVQVSCGESTPRGFLLWC
jgi:hypothetical protein